MERLYKGFRLTNLLNRTVLSGDRPKSRGKITSPDFFGNYDIKIREKDVEFYSRSD